YNNFYRSSNSGLSFPTPLIEDNGSGKFINPADYDDINHVLFTAKGVGTLYRVNNITGTPGGQVTLNISGMTDDASHIRCSPYSNTLFIGTDVGQILKVTNSTTVPSSTDITGSSMPAGSVSCIEVGANDNELLVTFFNYG